MKTLPSMLMTPLHVHGARSPEEYRRLQRKYLAQKRAARPALNVRDPYVSSDHPSVFVQSGKWLVRCACGNAPVVDPEARLACCFECGATYEDLTMPDAARAIEAVLVARPNRHDRGWLPSETIADLTAQNAILGVKERA